MAKIRIHNKRKQDLIFYIVMLAYPVLQFAIFYVGVNFNSILMAFQYFSGSTGKMIIIPFTKERSFLQTSLPFLRGFRKARA
jgi:hypothetical protein